MRRPKKHKKHEIDLSMEFYAVARNGGIGCFLIGLDQLSEALRCLLPILHQ